MWCRAVLGVLTVWVGCWQLTQSCNERKEECDQMMEKALEMATPDERCNGMTEFVTCVQEDIADCTDNKITDQYALNMKSMHCSQAYMCSLKLRDCYSKFSGAVQKRIQESDHDTRVAICSDLLKEIMTCQEEVTSQCQGQTGLMETVKNYQASLNMVCNDTDPCVTLVLQCQKSTEAGSEADTSDTEQVPPALSDCAAQKPVDYCGKYRKSASCIRSGLAACEGHLTVDNTLANLDNTIKELCDPVSTCNQNVSACLCHINQQSLRSPLHILTTICSTYPPFEQCLDSLGPECRANEEVSKEVGALKETYQKYHTLYCTTHGGLCPSALQCLLKLPQEELSSSESDLYATFLHINTLCSGGAEFFRCLETASTACENEASDVTFAMIEDNFIDMCQDIGPHAETLNDCPSFTQCLQDFALVEPGSSANSYTGDSHADVRHMFASVTEADFWCRYLTHSSQCITKTGPECGLDDMLVAVSIQRYRDLQRVCQGPTTTPAPTTTTTETPKLEDGKPVKGGHATKIFVSSHHWTVMVPLTLTVIHSLWALH